ncbi:hypothetical protein [Flavobacterium sp.]|uniref:hypothetical protein n=1 Tax=Flavobacterium sp. TaxID=239 RepID=UPI002635D75D|nr:hypothetical protein [Flavobacterium sp.]MDG2433015.1 hypothetical protein [Flavobacterium sp.]
MKKIALLFILVSLFYNALGYYLMLVQHHEQAWVSTIENKPDAEFQIIELNASIYSFIQDTDFEYVNENVVIDNKSYHVFKKRIQDNILSLYYLPNLYGDVIGKDLNDIVDNQLFNSAATKGSPLRKLLKSFLQDFIPTNTSNATPVITLSNDTPIVMFMNPKNILSGYLTASFTPPETV